MRAGLKKALVFASLIALFVVSACSGSTKTVSNPTSGDNKPIETAKPSTGKKTVSIGLSNAPGAFNPINATDSTAGVLVSVLFDPLMSLDEATLKFLPKLADSIETKDNLTYTVKLNPKAKWTDGNPVTADDVIFTVQLIGNPKVTAKATSSYALLEGFDSKGQLPAGGGEIPGVKKIDDYTIQYKMVAPTDENLFKSRFATINTLPKHIFKDVDPEKLNQHPFMQKPNVTNGAFKFVTNEKDQYVEFEANKDYFRGAPKLDKVFFKFMPSANIVAQLQSGEIDMNYPGLGTIAVQDFEKVKSMPNIKTISGKPLNYQMMYYNMQTIPNAKVRQAIAYAMDRKTIVDSLLKREGEIMDVPYTSIHPNYKKDLKPYPYDPAKAKALLQEGGWDFNKTLNFVVPTGNKSREQSADIIVENLKAVGVKATIQKVDLATVLQLGKKHEFDLLLLGLTFSIDPDLSMYLQTNNTSYNYSGYSSKEMDDLLIKGLKEMDPAKRTAIYNDIQDIIVRDLPQISLYADYRLGAVNKRVKVGVTKDLNMLADLNQWDVD